MENFNEKSPLNINREKMYQIAHELKQFLENEQGRVYSSNNTNNSIEGWPKVMMNMLSNQNTENNDSIILPNIPTDRQMTQQGAQQDAELFIGHFIRMFYSIEAKDIKSQFPKKEQEKQFNSVKNDCFNKIDEFLSKTEDNIITKNNDSKFKENIMDYNDGEMSLEDVHNISVGLEININDLKNENFKKEYIKLQKYVSNNESRENIYSQAKNCIDKLKNGSTKTLLNTLVDYVYNINKSKNDSYESYKESRISKVKKERYSFTFTERENMFKKNSPVKQSLDKANEQASHLAEIPNLQKKVDNIIKVVRNKNCLSKIFFQNENITMQEFMEKIIKFVADKEKPVNIANLSLPCQNYGQSVAQKTSRQHSVFQNPSSDIDQVKKFTMNT